MENKISVIPFYDNFNYKRKNKKKYSFIKHMISIQLKYKK